MKYARLLAAIAGEYWAMEPLKLGAMMDIVKFAAEGGKLGPDEVAARIDAAKMTAAQDRAVRRNEGGVAILPLGGVISNRAPMVENVSTDPGTSVEKFGRQYREAMNDNQVKAIIIDTNTPGGTVSGVPELADEIFTGRNKDKPVIAHVNALNASAGYWITSAADEIVATPSAQVGSVGVYTLHEDISKWLEAMGLKETLISAGKFKVEGNPFEPLSDEAEAAIQGSVNEYYEMFTDAVARHRGVKTSEVRGGFGEGRTLIAKQALNEGMIDRVATLNETLARFGVGPLAEPSPQAATPRRNMAQRKLGLIS